MTLPNRVAPDGTLHAHPARGTLLGNRGRLHDPRSRAPTGRRQASSAWIACELAFKGRRRQVWGAGYSEIFFLDEVTALAAGHRPCFECRRAEARAFAALAGERGPGGAETTASALDRLLAPDRRGDGAPRPVRATDLAALPDGAVLRQGAAFFALRAGRLLVWNFDGYALAAPLRGEALLVTPHAALRALAGGYRPRWHGSAGSQDAPPRRMDP